MEVDEYIGVRGQLGIPQNSPARRWGWGRLSGHRKVRLEPITVLAGQTQEPRYLVSSLPDTTADVNVRIYKRRMWIEATFRDLKNRNWGSGVDAVRLSEPDRQFLVVALTFVILCAFGATAENLQIDKLLQANTAPDRVMNLARIGNYFLQIVSCTIDFAFNVLKLVPT